MISKQLTLVLGIFAGLFLSHGQEPKRDTSAPKGGWIVPTAEELKKVEAAIPAELPTKPKADRKLLVYSLSHGFKHNSRLIGEEMLKLIEKIQNKISKWIVRRIISRNHFVNPLS